MTTTECRVCGAPIRFVPTGKKRDDGRPKLMPLDLEPDPDGNVVIRSGLAVVVTELSLLPETTYMPHFATCASQEGSDPPVSKLARRSDPHTSHEAPPTADARAAHQRAVLDVLAWGPATDEGIYARIKRGFDARISPSSARTRRSELVAKGLVRDTGRREPTESGRKAIVWELVS